MKRALFLAAALLCSAMSAQASSDIECIKTADAASYNYLDTATFTLEVTNWTMNVPMGAVEDVLPAGLTYVSATASHGGICSYDSPSRTVFCYWGGLMPWTTYTVTVVTTVSTTATTTITNNAEGINLMGSDPDMSNNIGSVQIGVN